MNYIEEEEVRTIPSLPKPRFAGRSVLGEFSSEFTKSRIEAEPDPEFNLMYPDIRTSGREFRQRSPIGNLSNNCLVVY
eukprot:1510740-Pyramimonas_sp.AAC.2